MSVTWNSDVPPPVLRPAGMAGWLRVGLRGTALAALVYGGLACLLLLRLVERPIFANHRPVTPHVTRLVCRGALAILGLRVRIGGQPMAGQGALVANHASWLDIFVLNAVQTLYFVSKAEVAGWPGIGWLARATGTVFITRSGRDARGQTELLRHRLAAGHRLLFFPEGTSSDGRRVLPFKSTLFAAFLGDGLRQRLRVQPLSVTYHVPAGCDPRLYGWWGDMDFAAHLLGVLAQPGRGTVDVVCHPPISVAAHPDRKALARACETAVRAGMRLP